MRIAILGATGQAGRLLCRLLLDEDDVDVLACGRDASKLQVLESWLSDRPRTLTTTVCSLDDDERLREVIESVDIVVGATSSWRDGPHVAARAVAANTSYLGLYMSNPAKWSMLRRLDARCRKTGCTVVDDGGLHPGLPGAMIRFVQTVAALRSIRVGCKLRLNWGARRFAQETILDFGDELRVADPTLLVEGEWVTGYRHSQVFDFNDGRPTSCVPMALEEIREVAEEFPNLDSVGFFMAGFGPRFDYTVLPLALALGRFHRRAASRILYWGLSRLTSSEEVAVLLLDGVTQDGRPLTLRVAHTDAYALTVIPAIATLRQMSDSPRSGVRTQASFVEPERFFRDLENLGVHVVLKEGV